MIMKLFSLFTLVATTFTTSAYANSQGSEGAYAYSADSADPAGTCFLDFGFRKWGWSIGEIPIDTIGEFTFNIYAEAAQCDIDVGNLVGQLEVHIYECGNPTNCVLVEYNTYPGYSFTAVNLYLGCLPVPMNKNNGKYTVSPGQYTIKQEFDVATTYFSHEFDNVMDDFYIIAFADTCEE